ncbi:endolytic transglycosylase MltG [Cohnella fermenti]|uniref:Endolytic murein transglycosylase n=1 Tax=Cohnella fermenti TaxID=2565925 RepID=A0A4S4C300_9BACL|nr:endolytic transglycosylase MltG [Cohnella fermenti]THF79954.1 endolytic transglycosylase MltG [Cohnella fermenti]
MGKEHDGAPEGWRSVYSDRREENTASDEDTKPIRIESDGANVLGGAAISQGRTEAFSAQRREAAGSPAGTGADSGRPDVGYPREFPSAAEENKGRQGKSPAASAERKEPGPEKGGSGKGTGGKKRRRKPRPLFWSFFIALGLVLAVVAAVLFYVWNGMRTPAVSATPVKVTIERGMSANEIADELTEEGLIKNSFLFGIWLKFKNEGSQFQAGEYEMTPGMTREQIVGKLNAGDTIAAATIKFTIPEGFTVVQMADRLAAAGYVDKAAFLEAMANPAAVSGSTWTKLIPADSNLRYPLEGYLFPETYEMKQGATVADIVNRMASELDRKLDSLPEEWQNVLEERGMTVHELLTMASLVEREVVIDEERPIVAGVIKNRLDKKMPLQIDATIQYLLDKQKEKLSTDDLKVDSPYNTYLNPGLPPGPIASPSLKSIEAVLYPADTDYLYYVTKKDGTNEHLFASTYKQHQKNIQTSEKNEKK